MNLHLAPDTLKLVVALLNIAAIEKPELLTEFAACSIKLAILPCHLDNIAALRLLDTLLVKKRHQFQRRFLEHVSGSSQNPVFDFG